MKTVLLVTTYFAPDNTIAAIRTTKLVKYMLQNGYKVDVVAVDNPKLNKDEILARDAEGVSVRRVKNMPSYFRIEERINRVFGPVREKTFNDLSNRIRRNPRSGKMEFYPFETAHPWIASVFYGLAMYREYDLYRYIRKAIPNCKSYDFIVTSYGDEFCYYFGKEYHRLHPETRWIFDVRDAIYRYKFIPGPLSFIPLLIERSAWKKADAIVGVSKGICLRVDRKNRKKTHLVTNGYDKGDRVITDRNPKPDRLVFAFTGSMYGGTRDLSVFFKSLRELIDKSEIDEDKIHIDFAGTKSASDIFHTQASKYNVDNLIIDHGKVPREEALKIQDSADVLLAPSYDYEDGNGGIITGKIFEYMSAEKPVIAVIVGDINHSELADIVRRTNIGFAYEEAHDDEDYKMLCNHLLDIYHQKMENGSIDYNPNQRELRRYDYRYLSRKFMRIMDPEYDRER